MIPLAAAAVVVLVAAPHLLDLRRVAPVTAAAIWGSALALRAAMVAGAAIYMAVFLPPNELFGAVTHSCWHTVEPLVSAHMGLSDHLVADAAIALPVLALAASLLLVGAGLIRAGRAVASVLRRHSIGPGPAGSVILGGADVVLAAAGVRRPQVVVSAGARRRSTTTSWPPGSSTSGRTSTATIASCSSTRSCAAPSRASSPGPRGR